MTPLTVTVECRRAPNPAYPRFRGNAQLPTTRIRLIVATIIEDRDDDHATRKYARHAVMLLNNLRENGLKRDEIVIVLALAGNIHTFRTHDTRPHEPDILAI